MSNQTKKLKQLLEEKDMAINFLFLIEQCIVHEEKTIVRSNNSNLERLRKTQVELSQELDIIENEIEKEVEISGWSDWDE